MQPESAKYLWDIQEAGNLILAFTEGKGFEDYLVDVLLRSAVERQFEIIGEALAQLARRDPEIAESIQDYRKIIAFRNVLIHGYGQIDHARVWDTVNAEVPVLLARARLLLGDV